MSSLYDRLEEIDNDENVPLQREGQAMSKIDIKQQVSVSCASLIQAHDRTKRLLKVVMCKFGWASGKW